MKHLNWILIVVMLSGCTMSFQPYPSVTRKEFNELVQQTNANMKVLAEKMNDLAKDKK